MYRWSWLYKIIPAKDTLQGRIPTTKLGYGTSEICIVIKYFTIIIQYKGKLPNTSTITRM